jgi:hypothetical protein
MLVPIDLVTDADVLALDIRADDDFGATSADLSEKRRVAVMDWLSPRLEAAGYDPAQHLTRKAPSWAYAHTGSAWDDVTDALSDATADDLDLSDVWVAPAADALYIGLPVAFRGLYVSMADSVNANSAVNSLTYWNGSKWQGVTSLADGTVVATGKAFSGGGRLTWEPPEDWAIRAVNEQAGCWVRLQVSSSLTAGTAVGQMLPIVRSRLTNAVAHYTLGLIYREGMAGTRGNWDEKAKAFTDIAEKELALVLPLIADEFDVDEDQAVSAAEVDSVTEHNKVFTWERG